MKRLLILFFTVLISITFVVSGSALSEELKGNLIIFHAGSLTIPFKELTSAFNEKYPNVNVLKEPAGSRTCARKISDLKKPCDVMASADYTVIEKLLIPNYTEWNLSFATNEMAIMYTKKSKYAKDINSDNWYKIFLKEGVQYGHSDPNADPCGYRSVLVMQLAEKHYKVDGLYRKLVDKLPLKNIRPKSVELIALIDTGELDYAFEYRSVCEQHKKPFVLLPDEINLKLEEYRDFYQQALVEVSGKKPGTKITKIGQPMVYGITIPKSSLNPEAAKAFIEFLISPEGQNIMKKNGQPPIVPAIQTGDKTKIPENLKTLSK